ncbi:glycosyltransferase family 4 protein [Glutamicibacter sp. BSL13]
MVEESPSDFLPIVITNDHDLNEQAPLAVQINSWTRHARSMIRYTSARSVVQLFRGYVDVRLQRPKILHFNSFFNSKFTIFPLLLWRIGFWGKPILLLAPRGEFGKGALDRHSFRKRFYIRFFRILGIDRAVIWHSTAALETQNIRSIWGPRARIVLRENHTLLPVKALFCIRKPQLDIQFVFLGRLVEHKGLSVVLESLRQVSQRVSLDIYGPEEDAVYAARCRDLVVLLPSNVSVSFRGPLAPEQVRETLAAYDALLMPTSGENFGHVIAESLSASCPVFTTSYTPWTSILNSGGGIVVNDREPENWRAAIERFIALPLEARTELRKSAGEAYQKWRTQPEKQHVWSLVTNTN